MKLNAKFLIRGLCPLLLTFLLGTACQPVREKDDRPNFIIFFTDELQFGDLGCYGGSIPTPNFDKLAAEGLRFTRAYTPASMCTPSRFALLTGQFPGRCQDPGFRNTFPLNEPYSIAWNTWLTPGSPTIARLLSREGYFTGMAGKWHVGSAPNGMESPPMDASADPAVPQVQEALAAQHALHQEWVRTDGGFDYAASVVWSNFDGHPLKALHFHNFPWITMGGLRFLETAAAKDQPFLLYFTPTAIHGPNHVKDLDYDVRLTPQGRMEEVSAFLVDTARLRSELKNISPRVAHRYAGMTQIDHQLGVVRQKLKDLGLADNTVILFMSDHNIEPGKATSFEKGIHIPMIVHWPGKTSGQVSDALVQTVDVLPTLLEAAGIPLPATPVHDGVSFLPLLDDPAASVRTHVFAENGYTRAVSDGRYKYIALRYPESLIAAMQDGRLQHVPSYVRNWPQPHSAIAMQSFPAYFDQDQFYDLRNDPYELTNLAAAPPNNAVLADLKITLEKHLARFDHPFSLAPVPFMDSPEYSRLQTVNRAFDLYSIPWLSRDHGGIQWPPGDP